jgi:hypothetical protein
MCLKDFQNLELSNFEQCIGQDGLRGRQEVRRAAPDLRLHELGYRERCRRGRSPGADRRNLR